MNPRPFNPDPKIHSTAVEPFVAQCQQHRKSGGPSPRLDVRYVLRLYGNACECCGAPVDDKTCQVSPLIPTRFGGPQATRNLAVLCATCAAATRHRDLLATTDESRWASALLIRRREVLARGLNHLVPDASSRSKATVLHALEQRWPHPRTRAFVHHTPTESWIGFHRDDIDVPHLQGLIYQMKNAAGPLERIEVKRWAMVRVGAACGLDAIQALIAHNVLCLRVNPSSSCAHKKTTKFERTWWFTMDGLSNYRDGGLTSASAL